MTTVEPLVRRLAPVRKPDRQDLLNDMSAAHEALSAWADRMARTPGPEARFLLAGLDAATSALARCATEVTVTYGLAAEETP